MFICEIWLFGWYFSQFCTSDMSKYGYLEVVSEGPFDVEIKRVDCIFHFPTQIYSPVDHKKERKHFEPR